MEKPRDFEIVDLFWSRNADALTETQKKYGGLLKSIACGVLGDDRDAEECVNDTYMAAWNAIPPHRPDNLPAFLVKIARENAIGRYKRAHAEKRGGGELPAVLEELSELLPGGPEPEDEALARELAREIDGFLAALPPQRRRMFVRRYFYADSMADIAASPTPQRKGL